MLKKKMNNLELSFNIVYHGTKWEKKYINTNFNYLKGGPQKKNYLPFSISNFLL